MEWSNLQMRPTSSWRVLQVALAGQSYGLVVGKAESTRIQNMLIPRSKKLFFHSFWGVVLIPEATMVLRYFAALHSLNPSCFSLRHLLKEVCHHFIKDLHSSKPDRSGICIQKGWSGWNEKQRSIEVILRHPVCRSFWTKPSPIPRHTESMTLWSTSTSKDHHAHTVAISQSYCTCTYIDVLATLPAQT